MTSKNTTGHNAGDPGSVESWLVSAGRDRRPGSPLNVPPCPTSNFVLGERRAYSRDDGTPSWEALDEIVGGLEGGSAVSFASGMAGIAAIFDQLHTGSVVALPDAVPCLPLLASAGVLARNHSHVTADLLAARKPLGSSHNTSKPIKSYVIGPVGASGAIQNSSKNHLAMRRQKSIAKVALGRNWRFACTGCGGMAARIRRRWSAVRTRDSSKQNTVHLMGVPLREREFAEVITVEVLIEECLGRTEADREITNEPWSSTQGPTKTNKTTLGSERRRAFNKDLTGPTLLSRWEAWKRRNRR